jgi:Smg protein
MALCLGPYRSGEAAKWAIVTAMFDVLVYLYENYWRPDACPDPAQLSRKLAALGFEDEDVQEALSWLSGLQTTFDQRPIESRAGASVRVYSQVEIAQLGLEAISFISFLETAGVLPGNVREIVIERAIAAAGVEPIPLESLKIIVLMVFWSLEIEPDALILDELLLDSGDRIVH